MMAKYAHRLPTRLSTHHPAQVQKEQELRQAAVSSGQQQRESTLAKLVRLKSERDAARDATARADARLQQQLTERERVEECTSQVSIRRWCCIADVRCFAEDPVCFFVCALR